MDDKQRIKIAVIGGGIAGLGFALALQRKGIGCDVYESVAEVKELGVGITLLPHATRHTPHATRHARAGRAWCARQVRGGRH